MNLSRDPETEGFDLQAGQSWIYPTNYPIREYQFNIVQKALLENTLVSLPTGLGKTFIAAVVMYNYFRWYPLGKIIFMAPTRPLVKQQVDACYDIMGIPRESTAELTGAKVSATREVIWDEKRVFFITPQILQNDLEKFENIGSKIRCLVFDEAHKARGNHAYCEVIRKLTNNENKYFRILALSATPGASINDVLEVVQNLLISHLEVRTEESLDVRSYVFQRNLTTVVIPLGEKLQQIKDEYLKILDINTRILRNFKVIEGNYATLTKGKIFFHMKNFQQKYSRNNNNGEIMKCFNACMTLYHGYDLLIRHGLRGFLTFFDEHKNNPLLIGNIQLFKILEDIREYLGPPPNLERLPDSEYPEISKDVKFGHPKFYKLRDILELHFKEFGNSSRAIVFFEYRDSVTEAYALLVQSAPLIKPRIFLGQRNGITQRIQIHVVKAFREGLCNTLLSTSIGEEGLDVGEVDLIICFDISNKSPIRMVQRMGRTGRKKEGSVIVLVTEGKEQQTLKDCLIHKNNVAHHVLGSKEISKGLIKNCPRLVPDDITLRCEKIFITVKKPVLKKTSSLKEMLRSISSSSSEPIFSQNLEVIDIKERIPQTVMLFNKKNPLDKDILIPNKFNTRMEKQRNLQEIHEIKHSKKSEMFVDLLKVIESKRFNIPMSQIGTGTQFSQNKNLKQTDIRNIFFKSQSVNDFAVPDTPAPKPSLEPTFSEEKSKLGSQELFAEIATYLSIKDGEISKCRFCPDFIDCEKSKHISKTPFNLNWTELDPSVFSSITVEDLKLFEKSLDKDETKGDFDDSVDFNVIQTPMCQREDLDEKSIFGEEFEKSYNFEVPKSFSTLIAQFPKTNVCSSQDTIPTQTLQIEQKHNKLNEMKNEPVFDRKTIFEFWGISSLSDLFDSRDKDFPSSQETIIYSQYSKSPDIFGESPIINAQSPLSNDKAVVNGESCSPVLCSFDRRISRIKDSDNFKRKMLVTRKLIDDIDTPSKFTLSSTKVSSTPLNSLFQSNVQEPRRLDVNDLFDIEGFSGINSEGTNIENQNTKECNTKSPMKSRKCLDVEFSKNNLEQRQGTENKYDNMKLGDHNIKKKTQKNLYLDDLFDISILDDQTNTVQIAEAETTSKCISEIIEISDSSDLSDFQDVPHNNLHKNLVKPLKHLEVQSNKTKTQQNLNKTSHQTCPSSEISITQLVSLVNREDDYFNGSSQKENVNANVSSSSDSNFKGKKSLTNSPLAVSSDILDVPSKPLGQDELLDLIPNLDETIRNMSANITLHSNPSDDEFETKPESPAWIKAKPNTKRKINVHDIPNISASRKRRKLAKEFIEDEAELSSNDGTCISQDEEDGQDQDCYDPSFVADESHVLNTQMHCKYLQSVRSPVIHGGFKIPFKRKRNKNVFSQEVNYEDETYLEDSFVVHEDDVQSDEELSQLEILERKLELQRKNRRKNNVSKPAKRKRIIEDHSDSSSS